MRQLGDYSLIQYLAAGGMADLYLAESPRFPDQDLVVKMVQPRYLEYTRVVSMFIDEGRIAKELSHPNIVAIRDVGRIDGAYYIAMEYIAGRDLLAVCRRGVEVQKFLPLHLGVAVVVQVLRGLIYAHERVDAEGTPLGIVHCDVSPGNIVLGWGGTCKIVDFGIARAAIQLRTEDHSVAGKYNYMAPEQIRGEAIDGRADVFALGVILYELTVQKRLFRGPPPKVMRMVLEEPLPRPTAVRRGFPAELERILLKALARDRRERYESARALYADLKGWLDASGQPSGKRELAEYLREVFGSRSAKVTESDDFSAVENLESEELALNHGVRSKSGLHELPLVVDPEESEAELVAPPPRLAAPAPTVSGPGGAATQRPEPRAEQAGRAKAKPARKGGDASLPIDLSSESDPDDAPDQSTALAAGGVQGLEHLGQQTADALAATPAPWGRRALLLLLVVVGAATLYLALRPST